MKNIEDKTTIGALQASLDRNSKQIRSDRARQIADTAKLRFRRKIEDMTMKLIEFQNNQDAILDMSPDNTHSIISATNFDADVFVTTTSKLAHDIFLTEQALNVLKIEYQRLFGEQPIINI
jgi:hypothetical protein